LSGCRNGTEPGFSPDIITTDSAIQTPIISDQPEDEPSNNENSQGLPQNSGQQSWQTPSRSDLPPSEGKIILYGELHAIEEIYDKEFELWYGHYHDDGMRHLFYEVGYSTAEMLNIWMHEENDEILDLLHRFWSITALDNLHIKEFFKKIKAECPETVFHGTDVEHQSSSIGAEYLSYLRRNGLGDSEHAMLARRANDQAVRFYQNEDDDFRENMLSENFILAFDKLVDQDVVGMYGLTHTRLDISNPHGVYKPLSVPNMVNQLVERYGDAVVSIDLTYTLPAYDNVTVAISGKEYAANHIGDQRLYGYKNNSHREFWRIEDAYADFIDYPTNGNVLPFDNFPIEIDVGQVFFVITHKVDGTEEKNYYRSDGFVWDGRPSTWEIVVEDL